MGQKAREHAFREGDHVVIGVVGEADDLLSQLWLQVRSACEAYLPRTSVREIGDADTGKHALKR